MKVCHLTSVHNYNDIRIFVKECKALSLAGYEVHLIAPNAPNEIEDGIIIHGVPQSSKGRLSRMTKSVLHVYSEAKKVNADIYHIHDPELILIGLMLRMQGKKVIYDIHEDVPSQILHKPYIPNFLRKLISHSFRLLENFSAKRFSGLVTATPYINKRFEELGCNTVNVNNHPIQSELFVPYIDWRTKDNAVVYTGGIHSIRGIFEMVEAIGYTDHKLYIAGNFSVSDEKKRAMNCYGWDNVVYHGYLSRRDMAELLRKAKAGLVLFHPVPNHTNSQPNKLFEYMSAGIPVIASDFPLWREIVEGNDCGICINPLNPKEISEAIKWIISHDKEAEKMGNNGRKAVLEKYNWESESVKLTGLYRRLFS